MPAVTVLSGPCVSNSTHIVHNLSLKARSVCVIGRETSTGIQLAEDNEVSKIHASVFCEEGVAYLEDRNSTNGTFLHRNGKRSQVVYESQIQLQDGDKIEVGSSMLSYSEKSKSIEDPSEAQLRRKAGVRSSRSLQRKPKGKAGGTFSK